MVVSNATAKNILETVLRYVPTDRVDELVTELKEIDGNQSFKDTVTLIERNLTKGEMT